MEFQPRPSSDVLDVLHKRRDMVSAIDGDTHDIRDLRDELDVSRSTVYNATRELESHRLVTRRADGFELTTFGRNAVESYDRCVETLDSLCALERELANIPADISLSPVLCHDAEVITAEPYAPDLPFETMRSFFEGATRIRGFAPVTGTRYIDAVDEALDEPDFSVEILTDAQVVDHLVTTHADVVSEWVDDDRIRVFETRETLQFGLLVQEEPTTGLAMLLYDDAGQLRVFVGATSAAAVEWGRDQYEQYRSEATELRRGVQT